MKQFSFVCSTTWPEVLSDWREREADWGWEEVWKSRGFESWDAWRATYVSALRLQDRPWGIYRADNPKELVPEMWAVGYAGWKQYYPTGTRKARLADIARHPDLPANVKVTGLLNSFPSPTTAIALRCRRELALFEGMHRGATISLAAQSGRSVAGEFLLALTNFSADEAELFERAITQKA